jgi:hypothetical protein
MPAPLKPKANGHDHEASYNSDGPARAGQTWNRSIEIKNTRERFRSTLRNLLLKDYDYRTGEIPAWLPVDGQDRWAEIIREGGRPDIGENRYGLYVRKVQSSGPEEAPAKQRKETPEAKDLRVAPTSQRLRFPLLDFGDMVPTDEDPYLIESLFPRHGLLVIWGKMKT